LWFSDFAEQLGYHNNSSLKIYWLLPGKTLADGLRLILSDTDTNVMAACALDVENLVVYFDHEDLYDSVNWDDDVPNPVSELPKVISPCKVQFAEKNRIEKLPVFYTNLDNIRVDQSVDNETESGSKDDELWDSDNEIEVGGADLFEDLVYSHVNVVKDSKKAKGSKPKTLVVARPVQGIGKEDTDDEGLDLPESDGEGDVRLRFTSFTEEDMQNPTFHVGLVFPSFTEEDMQNNNCEVFNSYILEARDLPILSMLERIKCQLMRRHYNKQQEIGEDIQGAFCPKIRKKGCKKCRICKYVLCFTIRTGCVPGADKGLPTHSRYQC